MPLIVFKYFIIYESDNFDPEVDLSFCSVCREFAQCYKFPTSRARLKVSDEKKWLIKELKSAQSLG